MQIALGIITRQLFQAWAPLRVLKQWANEVIVGKVGATSTELHKTTSILKEQSQLYQSWSICKASLKEKHCCHPHKSNHFMTANGRDVLLDIGEGWVVGWLLMCVFVCGICDLQYFLVLWTFTCFLAFPSSLEFISQCRIPRHEGNSAIAALFYLALAWCFGWPLMT